jgi:hypothetical protein
MIIRHKRTSLETSEINPRIKYLEYDTVLDQVYHKDDQGNVLKSWSGWNGGEVDFHAFAHRWKDLWYEIPWDEDLVMDEGL